MTVTIDSTIASLSPAAQLEALHCIHGGLVEAIEEMLGDDQDSIQDLLLEALAAGS